METMFGCKGVDIAPLETDYSLPDDEKFEELCETYRNSVSILEDDPTESPVHTDQQERPIENFLEVGDEKFNFRTPDFSEETIQKLLPNATVVDSKLKFGKNFGFETALRFRTDSGHILAYPRVKVFVKKNMPLVKNDVALFDVLCTALSDSYLYKADD